MTLASRFDPAYDLSVPATAGTGCENLIGIGAVAPFSDNGAFLSPAIPLWWVALSNRKVGWSLFPVSHLNVVRLHPREKGSADSKSNRSLL